MIEDILEHMSFLKIKDFFAADFFNHKSHKSFVECFCFLKGVIEYAVKSKKSLRE